MARGTPNVVITNDQVTWADSDSSGTTKNVDITVESQTLDAQGYYAVSVRNPSSETDLSVTAQIEEIFKGAVEFSDLTSWTVSSSTNDTVLVQGLVLGQTARIQLSNDSGLTASGGFTADVVVRRV